MAKKRAGALGHRKGATWSTYVAKVVPDVQPGPYDITLPSVPVVPSQPIPSPYDISVMS